MTLARLRLALRGFRVRVAVWLVLGMLVAGAGFEFLLVTLVRRGLEQELNVRSHSMLNLAAAQAYTALAVDDSLELADQLARLADEADVVAVATYRADGTRGPLRVADADAWIQVGDALPGELHSPANERRLRAGDAALMDLWAPVLRHAPSDRPVDEAAEVFGLPRAGSNAAALQGRVGWVRIVVTTARIEHAVAATARLGIFVLVIALVFAALALLALVRIMARPLREASTLARQIAGGQLDRRLPVRSADELGTLAESMNSMAAALEEARHKVHVEAVALRRATEATQAIARGAHHASDVREVFALVAEQARNITGCDGVALAVPEGPGGDVAFADFDPAEPWGEFQARARVTAAQVGRWFEAGQDYTRLDLDGRDDVFLARLREHGFRCGLLVPLGSGGATAGLLLLVSRAAESFPDSEVGVVTALASHLAAALEAAQTHERLELAIQELQRTRDSLVRSETLRLAGEMATGVAHEFNNVLGAILGRAQLLRREDNEGRLSHEALETSLHLIERAAKDGGETVRRLRQFGRSSEANESTTFDLREAIRDSIEFTRPRWENESQAAGRPVHLGFDAPEECWVRGRGNELREVFTNLLLNAVDALPRGGEIRLSASTENGRVRVSVEDDGQGMSEEVRARLFEPFFTTKGESGAGLGLSVVYGIVQRHGGSIRVESGPEHGARFDIELPLAPRPEVLAEPVRAARIRAGAALRVMVVDDEPAVRDLLRDIVAALGHEVEAYGSGVEAFKHYRPEKIDLLLTDLGMPGVSGWKLAASIRAVDPAVTIVFVTGWGEDMNLEEVREAGADLVIAKPFSIDDVIAAAEMSAVRRAERKAA